MILEIMYFPSTASKSYVGTICFDSYNLWTCQSFRHYMEDEDRELCCFRGRLNRNMIANLSSFYVELLTAVDSHIPTRPDLARGTKGTKRGAPLLRDARDIG